MLKTICYVLGAVCLVVFFSMHYDWRSEGTPPRTEVHLQLGFTPSPWFRFDIAPAETGLNIVFSSWSWLFGAAGLLLLWGGRKLGARATADAKTLS